MYATHPYIQTHIPFYNIVIVISDDTQQKL